MAVSAKQKAMERQMEQLADDGIKGWDDARVAAADAALQLRQSFGVPAAYAAERVKTERARRGL